MSDRSEIIGGIWAEGAANAPSSPVEGETYAKSNMSEEDINNGYGYKSTPDSAKFNEILRRITTLLTLLESNGVLPWCPDTTYEQGGLCIGYNGFTYRSLLGANTNNNPVTTGSPWWAMITLLQATEWREGKARLATLSEVLEGTGTTTIASPSYIHQKITSAISGVSSCGDWQTMSLEYGWVADYARYRFVNDSTSVQIQIHGLDGSLATQSYFYTFPDEYKPVYGPSLIYLPPLSGTGPTITYGDFYLSNPGGRLRAPIAWQSGYKYDIHFTFNI